MGEVILPNFKSSHFGSSYVLKLPFFMDLECHPHSSWWSVGRFSSPSCVFCSYRWSI